MHLDTLTHLDSLVAERLVAILAAQMAERDACLARLHPLRLDCADRERAGRSPAGLDQPFAPGLNSPSHHVFSLCGSQDGQPAMSVATCHTVLTAPLITASSLNEYIRRFPSTILSP